MADDGAPRLMLQRVTGRENAARMGPYWTTQLVAVDRFEPMCAPPCDIDLPAGDYQLGVSRGLGARPIRAAGPLTLPAGEVQLTLHYENREPIRAAGFVVVGILGVLGAGLVIGGVFRDFDVPLLVSGAGSFVVGLAVGLPLAFWWDSAEVHASALGVPIAP